MKKIIFILILLNFSVLGKAQTFCDTMFGNDFHFKYELNNSTEFDFFNFNLDTLDFLKNNEEIINSYSIKLICKDSNFQIVTINLMPNENGDEIHTISYDPGNDGKWKYSTNKKIISFKMFGSEKWFHFKIIQKGKEGDNPYLTWTGSGDYRYLIRLIRVK